MQHYRSAPLIRTPPPDAVRPERGANPAVGFSYPPPDIIGSQRNTYLAIQSSPPPNIQRIHRPLHPARPAAQSPPRRSNPRDDQHTMDRPDHVNRSHFDFVRPSSSRSPPLPPQGPDFLIIGLFALRLTKRLIEGLEPYPHRDTDIAWFSAFLAPYPAEYALGKVSGRRKEEYLSMYQDIVSRMKKQPRYPVRFMRMNPDRRGDREREMTDPERLDIIDFCDAASEWGSVVPIPAKEADRMIELAEQRRIADLE